MSEWLIDETSELSIDAVEPELAVARGAAPTSRSTIAVRLNDVVVHDAKKWFGGADIRLDAIVVTGGTKKDTYHHPKTARFPGVRDGDRLPIFEPGLLVYLGKPRHFIDIAVAVSRDRGDSEDLAELIAARADDPKIVGLGESVAALAGAAPQAAAMLAAVRSAASVADWAVKLLGSVTGSTVGLYRASFLQRRDKFGIGRHPESGAYTAQDLSFWYEIVRDR